MSDFNFSTPIRMVNCNAEGEVGDVIISGAGDIPGATLWDQSRYLAQDQKLRNYVHREPRGGVFRHVNLLVKPLHPEARIGFIIMEPEDTPPMSGSNSICVATVALETGLIPVTGREMRFKMEAPGGLEEALRHCWAHFGRRSLRRGWLLPDDQVTAGDHLRLEIRRFGVVSATFLHNIIEGESTHFC